MQVDIQMIITHGDKKMTHDVLCLERKDLSIETLGLTLKESKAMAVEIQKTMIDAQVKEYMSQHRACAHCEKSRLIKSYHKIALRTLFGKIEFFRNSRGELPIVNSSYKIKSYNLLRISEAF